jgi:hypothetical protein
MIIREIPASRRCRPQLGFMEMNTEQNVPQKATATNRPVDLLSRLYREIGISAVAAALEACKPQKSAPRRKDIPAVLRDGEAV